MKYRYKRSDFIVIRTIIYSCDDYTTPVRLEKSSHFPSHEPQIVCKFFLYSYLVNLIFWVGLQEMHMQRVGGAHFHRTQRKVALVANAW